MNRTTHGRPVPMINGQQVVAADALALLSGVNFSSVEKVVAAIHALNRFSGTPLTSLLDLSDFPKHRVLPSDDEFQHRATDTMAVVRGIVQSDVVSELDAEVEAILKLGDRF